MSPTTGHLGGAKTNKWVLLGLCSLANFLVYFHRVTPAVMVNELMAEFGGTAALIGVLSSTYFYAYTAMQIPVGYMTDRLPLRLLIGLGTMLAGISSILFGVAGNMGTALAARTITGLGVSAVLIPSYKILSVAFGERFMMANGILMAAGAAGALGASSPLAMLIDAYGWRSTFYIIAAASFLVGFLCLAFIKGPWDARNEASRRADKGEVGKGGGALGHLRHALLPGTVTFFKYGPLVAFQGLWGVPFLMASYSMTKVSASQVLFLLSVSTITGGLLVGPLTSVAKVGQGTLLKASSALFLLCWIPMVLKPSAQVLSGIYASMAVMGAADIIVLISINNYIRRTTTEQVRGTVLGMTNMMTLLGGAIYQPVMGLFVNGAASGYTSAFMLCIAGAAISLTAAIFLSRKLS